LLRGVIIDTLETLTSYLNGNTVVTQFCQGSILKIISILQTIGEIWADDFAMGTEQEADFWERLQKEWDTAGSESG